MNIKWVCVECDHEFIESAFIKDGSRCHKCGGAIFPKSEVEHCLGKLPEPPKPRIIREGVSVFCPKCHSTMSREWPWKKRMCDGGCERVAKLTRRFDGLTEQEGKVMDALNFAWNGFIKLEVQHPSDVPDFTNAIHQCQQVLGMRILQRDYPQGWPIKK